MSIQLYMILATNFAINLVEIGVPLLRMFWRKKKWIENTKALTKGEQVSIELHSPEYQMLCENYSSIMDEYTELVVLFGYVTFFSVACPLTPLLVFLLIYVEKFVDTYKFFFLTRITIIEGTNGIEIYNKIFKLAYFLGMLCNIGVVLFTSKNLINSSITIKLIIYAGLENLVFLMIVLLTINILPKCTK